MSDDAAAGKILARFGLTEEALLGHGGESRTYALDAERVLRVHYGATKQEGVASRTDLLAELQASATNVPFAIPEVLESRLIEGRVVNVERRLPGRTLTHVLGESRGEARAELVRAYLDASSRIADLAFERDWFGDLCQARPMRRPSFRAYLHDKADVSLHHAGGGFADLDAAGLASALPEPAKPELVHLDAFPGNMLTEDGRITAVIDFGGVPILGDRRLDPLASAAYLDDDITPTAVAADRDAAREWLEAHDLADLYPAARRWLGAFWSAAKDDAALHRWCGGILLA